MRRRVLFGTLSLLALACGKDQKSPGLAGTVGGKGFAPMDVRAVLADSGSGTCALPLFSSTTVDVYVSGLIVVLTSWADACADYASPSCVFHANGQTITLVVARLGLSGSVSSAPPIQARTYTLGPDASYLNGDGSGLYVSAFADATSFGGAPTCDPTTSPAVLGGTLTLSTVASSGVAGHVEVSFQDGGSLSGDFSAEACPGLAPDICQLAETQSFCTLPATCVP